MSTSVKKTIGFPLLWKLSSGTDKSLNFPVSNLFEEKLTLEITVNFKGFFTLCPWHYWGEERVPTQVYMHQTQKSGNKSLLGVIAILEVLRAAVRMSLEWLHFCFSGLGLCEGNKWVHVA